MIKKSLVGLCGLAGLACQPSERFPGTFSGVVEFDERDLAFEIGGRVREVTVQQGDQVAQDTVLARLDPSLDSAVHRARLSEAEAAEAQVDLLEAGARPEEVRAMQAEVEALRSNEAQIERNLQRERGLLEKGASTQVTLDELSARLEVSQAQRRALEQRLLALRKGARKEELESVRARSEAATRAAVVQSERIALNAIASPMAGVVLDTHFAVGEVVAPGVPVVTLADPAHPFVDVFVPQGEIDAVEVGGQAEIFTDAEPAGLPARVQSIQRRTEFTPRFLFSTRERANLVIRVRLQIEDPEQRLHAGVPAFAKLLARSP